MPEYFAEEHDLDLLDSRNVAAVAAEDTDLGVCNVWEAVPEDL